MWSSVTSKLEAHANNLGQSNVQSPAGQNNSSGSIKGKASLIFQSFQIIVINKYAANQKSYENSMKMVLRSRKLVKKKK